MRNVVLGRNGVSAAGLSLALLSLFIAVPPSHAQQPAATSDSAAPATSVDASLARRVTVAQALKTISTDAGIVALADSTVGQWRIDRPTEKATLENAEAQIAAITDAAGHTATWAKLYLPAGDYTGDDVVAYALAQARLVGKPVGNAPSGTIEILGKSIPADRAQSYIAEFNLKPVYVITSSHPIVRPASQWASMNADQRAKYAKDQAAWLATADAATQQAFMQEHMAVLKNLMTALTPDQRSQMFGPNSNVKVFISPDGSKQQVEQHVIQVGP